MKRPTIAWIGLFGLAAGFLGGCNTVGDLVPWSDVGDRDNGEPYVNMGPIRDRTVGLGTRVESVTLFSPVCVSKDEAEKGIRRYSWRPGSITVTDESPAQTFFHFGMGAGALMAGTGLLVNSGDGASASASANADTKVTVQPQGPVRGAN